MLSEEQLEAIKKVAGDIAIDPKLTPPSARKPDGAQSPDAKRKKTEVETAKADALEGIGASVAKKKRKAAVTELGGGPNYGRRAEDEAGVTAKSAGRRKSGRNGGRRQSDVEPALNIEEVPLAPPPPELTAHRSRKEVRADEHWSLDNLRWSGERAFGDIANVLRIFNLHPEFAGRFRFNKSMGKVMDKGTVMLGWQLDETVGVVQERFIPEVAPETVIRALMICANRNSEKPL